jgi:hypothetical protein
MKGIKLNFINNSNDSNNSSIVIFAKNAATDFDELAIAWKVIQNCGRGDNHPFVYEETLYVSAGDSYGNYTPELLAQYGQQFEMVKSTSGDVLQMSAQPASGPTEIEIANNLERGAISGNVYRSGSLYASTHSIAPGQKAVFSFKPTIWIGVASQITEGDVMNSAIISDINTEISLLGIASADIVMTGGGPGANATPFEFSLEKVTMA